MFAGTQLPGQVNQNQVMQLLSGMGQNNPYLGQAGIDLTSLYNGYNQAFGAIVPEEQASLSNYDTQSALAQKQAMGSMNARGLTNSLLGTTFQQSGPLQAGQGSGALQQLAQQRLLGRNQMQQGFVNQANQLNQDILGEAGQTANQYGYLGDQQQMFDAQMQAQNPNIFGLGALGVNFLKSGLIPGL